MKDRLREAIFNLIGPAIRGRHAVDLFAGTGALALEALSRGAEHATMIEQHHPTANIIRQNIATLAVQQQADVVPANVFIWWKMQRRGTGPPRPGRQDVGRILLSTIRLLHRSGRRNAGIDRRADRVGPDRQRLRRRGRCAVRFSNVARSAGVGHSDLFAGGGGNLSQGVSGAATALSTALEGE